MLLFRRSSPSFNNSRLHARFIRKKSITVAVLSAVTDIQTALLTDELRELRQISGQRIAVDPQQIRCICRYCPELRNLFSDKNLPQLYGSPTDIHATPPATLCPGQMPQWEQWLRTHWALPLHPCSAPGSPGAAAPHRNDHCCRLEPRQVKGLRGCHTGDAVIFTMLRCRCKWDILHPGSRNIAMDLIRQHQT